MIQFVRPPVQTALSVKIELHKQTIHGIRWKTVAGSAGVTVNAVTDIFSTSVWRAREEKIEPHPKIFIYLVEEAK